MYLSKYLDQPEAEKPKSQDARSTLGEMGAGFKRGLFVAVPEMAGGTIKSIAGVDSDWYKKGQDLQESAQAIAKLPDFQKSATAEDGLVNKVLVSGAEGVGQMAPIIATGALNPYAGAALAAGMYGGSTYQDTKERMLKQEGLDDRFAADNPDDPRVVKAKNTGLATGATQGLGEGAMTLVGGKFIKGALPVGKAAVESVLGKAAKPGIAALKEYAKGLGIELAGETITEPLQDEGQAAVERFAGLKDAPKFMEQAAGSAQGGFGTALLLAPFGIPAHVAKYSRSAAVQSALTDPAADPAARVAAAQLVAQDLQKVDPAAATNFLENADDAIGDEATTGSAPYAIDLSDPALLLPKQSATVADNTQQVSAMPGQQADTSTGTAGASPAPGGADAMGDIPEFASPAVARDGAVPPIAGGNQYQQFADAPFTNAPAQPAIAGPAVEGMLGNLKPIAADGSKNSLASALLAGANPYQQFAEQPFTNAPAQPAIAGPAVEGMLGSVQPAPSSPRFQALQWAQQQMQDPATSKFERQNLNALMKAADPEKRDLVKYWASFTGQRKQPAAIAGVKSQQGAISSNDAQPGKTTQVTAAPTSIKTVSPAPKRDRSIQPATDDMITAIGKLGGLNLDQVKSQWGSTVTDSKADLNRHASKEGKSGILHVISSKGKSLDAMREALEEHGYLQPGSSIEDMYAKIDQHLGGKPTYSNQRENVDYDAELAAYEEQHLQDMIDMGEIPFSLRALSDGSQYAEDHLKVIGQAFMGPKTKYTDWLKQMKQTLGSMFDSVKKLMIKTFQQLKQLYKEKAPAFVSDQKGLVQLSLFGLPDAAKKEAFELRGQRWTQNDKKPVQQGLFDKAKEPQQSGKQPWEMTHKEEVEAQGGKWPSDSNQQARLLTGARAQERKALIQQALADGKPVPAEVLADYPDLARQRKATTPALNQDNKKKTENTDSVSAVDPASTLAQDQKTVQPVRMIEDSSRGLAIAHIANVKASLEAQGYDVIVRMRQDPDLKKLHTIQFEMGWKGKPLLVANRRFADNEIKLLLAAGLHTREVNGVQQKTSFGAYNDLMWAEMESLSQLGLPVNVQLEGEGSHKWFVDNMEGAEDIKRGNNVTITFSGKNAGIVVESNKEHEALAQEATNNANDWSTTTATYDASTIEPEEYEKPASIILSKAQLDASRATREEHGRDNRLTPGWTGSGSRAEVQDNLDRVWGSLQDGRTALSEVDQSELDAAFDNWGEEPAPAVAKPAAKPAAPNYVTQEEVDQIKTAIADLRAKAAALKEKKRVFQNGQNSIVSATNEQLAKSEALYQQANDLESEWYAALHPSEFSADEMKDAINKGFKVLSPTPATSGPSDTSEKTDKSKPAKPASALEAGEELIYNRRNRVKGVTWDDLKDSSDALKAENVKKEKVYSKPDYAALIDDGMPALIAHIVKQTYDAIPNAPVTRRTPTDADFQTYILAVNRVMDATMKWATSKEMLAAWAAKQGKAAGAMQYGSVTNVSDLIDNAKRPYDLAYPNGWREFKDEVYILGGNKLLSRLQPGYDEIVRAGKDVDKGWPGKVASWQKQGYSIGSRDDLTIREWTDTKGEQRFAIRLKDRPLTSFDSRDEAQAFIDSKKPFLVVFKNYNIKGSFDTRQEAEAGAKQLVTKEKKAGPDERGMNVTSAERIGPERRLEGESVSAKQIMDTFGFRGINIGNWVPDDEAQLHLNFIYDSLFDLAEIIGVPPKALSLNGTLGIAVGAQGGGGRASAHYVPAYKEINITRTAGAGAFVHELGHALDNWFGEMGKWATDKKPYLSKHQDNNTNGEVRPEVVEAFKRIAQTMKKRLQTPAELAEQTKRVGESSAKTLTKYVDRMQVYFDNSSASDEVKAEAARLLERIRNKDVGDGYVAISSSKMVSPVIADLYQLAKKHKVAPKYSSKIAIDEFQWLHQAAYSAIKNAGATVQQEQHVPLRMVDTDYAKASAEADKGKPVDKLYWSTPWEMFARAFDAYITDKVAAEQRKNSYLSGLEAVAPQGEERTAINAAFDKLFNALKTKETGRGISLYAQTENTASPEEQQRIQQAITGKNATEVLQYLIDKGPTVAYKMIATRAMKAIKAAGMPVNFTIAHVGDSVPAELINRKGNTDLYQSGKIEIRVNGIDTGEKSGMHMNILLHEFVHAATMGAMNNPTPATRQAIKDIESVGHAIAEIIKQKKDSGQVLNNVEQRIDARDINALEDADEVLTWGLTIPEFQNYLETIPHTSGSLWSRFVSAVRSLLGLHPKADTALSTILKAADTILDNPMVYSDRKGAFGRGYMKTQHHSDIVKSTGMVDDPSHDKEYAEVEARYFNADGTEKPGAMLAPNGKRSNLNKRQWIQVRTGSFKKWFGDWEALSKQIEVDTFVDWAIEQQDPRKDIVLRDVSDAEIASVLSQGGPDLTGMQHLLDAKEIKHAWKHHNESRTDQRNLEVDDLKRIPVVLDAYDALTVQPKGHNKTSVIYSKKFDDGLIEYVERVFETSQKNKPRLLTKTVWVKSDVGVKPNTTRVYTPVRNSNLLFSGGRVNPDSVSKVVDANGEPLVVYHGTETGGYSSFSTSRKSKVEGAYFFSDNRDLAKTYSGLGNEIKIEDPDEYGEIDEQRGIYSAFLNIRDEHVYDFGGANWDGQLTEPYYDLLDEDGDVIDTVYSYDEVQEAIDEGRAAEYNEVDSMFTTTDSEVREAQRYGKDGAVLYEVKDPGPQSYANDEAGTVYVAFDVTNIKSATQNTGAFDSNNEDIRYSLTSPTTGLNAADLQQEFAGVPFKSRIKVVQSADELPGFGSKSLFSKMVEGQYKNGTIYLVAGNLPSVERARIVALGHELTHAGQNTKLVALAVQWFRDAQAKGENGSPFQQAALQMLKVEAVKRGYDIRKEADFVKAVKEATAVVAEYAYKNGEKSSLMNRLLIYLKHWLRKAGIAIKFTDKELISTVTMMMRQGEQNLTNNTGPDGGQFAAAWHGSPHDHNGFSTEHIGTGEGAQAYGYGLYFAGNREVAEYYRDNIRKESASELGKIIKEYSPEAYSKLDKATRTNEFYGTGDSAIGYLIQNINSSGTHSALGEDWQQVYDTVKSMPGAGRLYKVELAPSEDEYLLWDKPLSEQSEKVKAALRKLSPENRKFMESLRGAEFTSDLLGHDIYRQITRDNDEKVFTGETNNRSDKSTSEYLHSLGIRGIKYLDGNSRSGKKEDYNYVIFNDADVSITDKFSLASSVSSALSDVDWKAAVTGARENWKQTANPLDWSRTSRWFDDWTPESVKAAFGYLLAVPHFQAERDATKRPFVDASENREIDRMDMMLQFLGFNPGQEDTRSLKEKTWDFFTKWQSGQHQTDWEKMNQRRADLSIDQKKALDALFVEGDVSSASYSSMEKALTNPRIARTKPTAETFALYRDIRNHMDNHVAKIREQRMERMMREAGVDEGAIKAHIADYRNDLREVGGWMTRNHGDGEHATAVYHVVKDLKFEVREVKDNKQQAYLPYFPGNAVLTRLQDLAKQAGHKVKVTPRGAVIVTGDSVQGFVDEAGKIIPEIGPQRVMVFSRYHQTKGAARNHAELVKQDLKAAMPHNYRPAEQYEVTTRQVDMLNESMYQNMRSDMAVEALLEQSAQRALKRGEMSKEQYNEFKQDLVQNTAEVLMGRAAGRYQIRRAEYLIEGYDTENALSLYQDYMMGVAGMMSKADYAAKQFENFRTAKIPVKQWAAPYIFDSLRNQGLGDRISGNLRAFASLWYMGLKPASALINATQNYTLGIAELGRHIKKGSPLMMVAKANADIIKGKLTKDEEQLFESAIYRQQEMGSALSEITGHNEAATSKAGKLLHNITGKTLALFQNVEVMNRKTMILSAYRAFKSKDTKPGMIDQAAFDKAMEINSSVNFNMHRGNLPGWARTPVGHTLYALQSFTFNSFNWMYNRMTSGEKQDMIALLRYAGAIMAIAGVAALPGGDELDKLYRKLFNKSLKLEFQQYTRKNLKQFGSFGELVDNFAWHGLGGVSGLNISNSLRLQIPVVSQVLGGESAPEAMGGVFSGLIQKAGTATKAAAKGDWYRATEAAAPEAVSGAMRAYRQATRGVTTMGGKQVFDENGKPVKYSATDAALRMAGLQPLEQSRRTEVAQTAKEIAAEWNSNRQDMVDRFRIADKPERQKMLKLIQEFNVELRGSQAAGLVQPISMETLRNASQQRTTKADKKKAAWQQNYLN